jgi:hypothetical protein
MNVQIDGPSAVVLPQTKPLAPGYLVTPFGWAAQLLATIIEANPTLLVHLFELDKTRMHTIALALAHLDESPPPGLAPVLFSASVREVLHRVLNRSPAGSKGVLRRLPFSVLSRQGYLRLIDLLDDPSFAKLLHHSGEAEITESVVRVLYEIPTVLRPALAAVIRCITDIEKLDHLPDGLHWLASRGAAASFDALVADLAGQAQPAQFVARLKKLVSKLPLPQTLPPQQIGKARRIDGTADICGLAKRFRNCLEHYVRQIDAGICAVYLWDDEISPAVCELMRQGRVGWSLSEALGPKNEKLDKSQLKEITTAFADAGIPEQAAFRSLECILETNCITTPRTRRQRQRHLEQRLLRLEEAAWIEDVVDA